jgi:SPP1 family predicted phage head-tail adaptor
MKCCDINAGMLKTPISIQRPTKTSDGAGGYTETWASVRGSAKRAFVKSFSGREQWVSERTEARTSLRIVCRYTSNILQTDRVVIRDKRYDIIAINNVEFEDKWLEIDLGGGVAT